MRKIYLLVLLIGAQNSLYAAASSKDEILERFAEAQADITFDRPGALDRLQNVSVHDYEEFLKKLLVQALGRKGEYSDGYVVALHGMLRQGAEQEFEANGLLMRSNSLASLLDVAIFSGNIKGVREILTSNPDLSVSSLATSPAGKKVSVEKAVKKLIKNKKKSGRDVSDRIIKASLEELTEIQKIIREYSNTQQQTSRAKKFGFLPKK